MCECVCMHVCVNGHGCVCVHICVEGEGEQHPRISCIGGLPLSVATGYREWGIKDGEFVSKATTPSCSFYNALYMYSVSSFSRN